MTQKIQDEYELNQIYNQQDNLYILNPESLEIISWGYESQQFRVDGDCVNSRQGQDSRSLQLDSSNNLTCIKYLVIYKIDNKYWIQIQKVLDVPQQEQFPEYIDQDQQQYESEDEYYLNISFQQIVNLLLNNESPILDQSIKKALRNSQIIVYILLVYFWSLICIQTLVLFQMIYYKNLGSVILQLEGAFSLFKCMTTTLVLYSLFMMNYAIQQSPQNGEINSYLIEYLKYIIRNNQLFEGEEYTEQSQAQQVARSISERIRTYSWMNFLINYESGHIFSINRIVIVLDSLLFLWGNAILLQQADIFQINSIIIIYSLLIWYFISLGLIITLILLIAAIPLMLSLIIWQSCQFLKSFFCDIYRGFQIKQNQIKRLQFFNSLKVNIYHEYKKNDDEQQCVICLANYNSDDQIIQLPCNVGQVQINHFFHQQCINIWIESHSNCPICRKQFFEPIQDQE